MLYLIRNYNPNTKKYDKFYSAVKELSIEQLKKLLMEIPLESKYKRYPVSIISDNYIITRYNEDKIRYETNYGIRFGKNYFITYFETTDLITKWLDLKPIKDIDELLKEEIEISPLKKWQRLLLALCFSLFNVWIPLYNIILIWINLGNFSNILVFVFFSLLLALSFISIITLYIYSYQITDYGKSFNISSFKPYEDEIPPTDFSIFLLLIGQILYLVLFLYYPFAYFGFSEIILLNILFIIVLVLTSIYVLGFSTVYILLNRHKNKLKDEIVQKLFERMNQEKNIEKLYYQNLYFYLKEKKIFTARWIPIVLTTISFIFTIIPLSLY
jgi:hypothetical protein